MAERKNGLAPLPSGLFRPTTAPAPNPNPNPAANPAPGPAPGAQADEPADEPQGDSDEQGRGGEPAPAHEPRAPRAPRRKRAPTGGETRGRKLNLPDAVYDRLQLLAIQRRTTASAVAAEILDRNLPRLRIERD